MSGGVGTWRASVALIALALVACARPRPYPTGEQVVPAGPEAVALGITHYRVQGLSSRPTRYDLLQVDGGSLGQVMVTETGPLLTTELHLDASPSTLDLVLEGAAVRLSADGQELAHFEQAQDRAWNEPATPLPPIVRQLLPTLTAVLADDAVQGPIPMKEPAGSPWYGNCQEACDHCGWCGDDPSRFSETRCPMTCWRCLACVQGIPP